MYIILAGITRFSQSGRKPDQYRNTQSINSISSIEDSTGSNFDKTLANPYDHIRSLQLNKIRINNARQWDVAKYDEFLAEGNEAYVETENDCSNQEQIINEEVKISDFAYSVF